MSHLVSAQGMVELLWDGDPAPQATDERAKPVALFTPRAPQAPLPFGLCTAFAPHPTSYSQDGAWISLKYSQQPSPELGLLILIILSFHFSLRGTREDTESWGAAHGL